MPKMTEEVKSFECVWCNKLYSNHRDAAECAFKHARKDYANALLNRGDCLGFINNACGFGWKLSDERKEITKNNCFVISYWQCCNKPAYQIVSIESNGRVFLVGKGGWSGYYGGMMPVNRLPKPHPGEELFVFSQEKE